MEQLVRPIATDNNRILGVAKAYCTHVWAFLYSENSGTIHQFADFHAAVVLMDNRQPLGHLAFPSHRALAAFAAIWDRLRGGPCRAAFQATQASQCDGMGILRRIGRLRLFGIEFRGLPSGFKHDLVCKLVWIARTLL